MIPAKTKFGAVTDRLIELLDSTRTTFTEYPFCPEQINSDDGWRKRCQAFATTSLLPRLTPVFDDISGLPFLTATRPLLQKGVPA